jgi:hypothetical protein
MEQRGYVCKILGSEGEYVCLAIENPREEFQEMPKFNGYAKSRESQDREKRRGNTKVIPRSGWEGDNVTEFR